MCVDKGAVQGFDGSHNGMQPAHELLYGQHIFLVFKTEFECNILLIFQVQTVISSAGELMEMIANEPDKGQLLLQALEFVVGQFPRVLQISGSSQTKQGFGQPEDMVIIPQSADTLFKIGFKKVAGIPEDIGSDSVLVFQPSGKGSGLSCREVSEKPIGKGKIYRGISTDKSLIQHGGKDLVVILAQT